VARETNKEYLKREHQLKMSIMKHLSLRRKGDMVQLVWTEKGDDTWTTIFSEVNVRGE